MPSRQYVCNTWPHAIEQTGSLASPTFISCKHTGHFSTRVCGEEKSASVSATLGETASDAPEEATEIATGGVGTTTAGASPEDKAELATTGVGAAARKNDEAKAEAPGVGAAATAAATAALVRARLGVAPISPKR